MADIDRTIDEWGRSIFRGDDAIELLFNGCDITKLCMGMTPEIEAYNEMCTKYNKLDHVINPIQNPSKPADQDASDRQSTWWIPDRYFELDVRTKLLGLTQTQEETDRVNLEMDMFDERGLLPVLRLMCYLVDRWREKGVVWGVGRGSSVASYCLFLIGVHRIDAIYYRLDINEFLK